jgi:hypothetical protein
MTAAGGGWTRVVHIGQAQETWNAWNQTINLESAVELDESFGLPMEWFSDSEHGEELEIMFVVDGTRKGSIYRGVKKAAWNPDLGAGTFDQEFEYQALGSADWTRCERPLGRDHDAWNWSIASAGAQSGCSNCSGGNGFLLEGTEDQPFSAFALSGLNYAVFNNSFGFLSVYIRRTP